MSQVANTIFEFGNQTVKRFDCDYHDYLELLSHTDEEEESFESGLQLPTSASSSLSALQRIAAEEGIGFNMTENDSSLLGGTSSEEEDLPEKSKKAHQNPTIKDRMTARYVEGDKYRITKAKEVVVEEKNSRSKNFGGSGVTSGNLFKGVKNAKRYTN